MTGASPSLQIHPHPLGLLHSTSIERLLVARAPPSLSAPYLSTGRHFPAALHRAEELQVIISSLVAVRTCNSGWILVTGLGNAGERPTRLVGEDPRSSLEVGTPHLHI